MLSQEPVVGLFELGHVISGGACLAAVEHRPSAVAQAAPDVRIGGGQRRRAPKNRSKLGGSGGMPPGKFFSN